MKAYARPVARLDVVRALARKRVVRGAIDVSDGLSSDLIHLCEAGGVGCEIHADALPIPRRVRAFCAARGIDAIEWAQNGGEDYALILCVPRASLAVALRAIRRAGVGCSVIGRFTRERGSYRIVEAPSRSRAFRRGGWDHLAKAKR